MGRVACIPEGMTVAEAEKVFVANGGRLYSGRSGNRFIWEGEMIR